MKDFIKWLGVNEKIAKVVVWIFIIMVFLIVTNQMLESTGFPNYKITYDNLRQIRVSSLIEYITTCIVSILNFYAIVLLVFRAKEAKSIFKYAILYLVLNILVTWGPLKYCLQIFIFVYILTFSYFYSNKNKKYIIYSIIAILTNIFIQGIWYLSKARAINYANLNDITKAILSLDYFIIMGIIILVKEIYLKKRGENPCGEATENQDVYSGSANSKTKINSQRKSQKK